MTQAAETEALSTLEWSHVNEESTLWLTVWGLSLGPEAIEIPIPEEHYAGFLRTLWQLTIENLPSEVRSNNLVK